MPSKYPCEKTIAHLTSKNPVQKRVKTQLKEKAIRLGADDACLLPVHVLQVKDHLANFCQKPYKCPSYGLCPGCPPHAMDPGQFRLLVQSCDEVLVFKINVSMSDLRGKERPVSARRIHEISAALERFMLTITSCRAYGYAAGSCKELFCAAVDVCPVLEKKAPCLHPLVARPSLSAVGVDFTALAQAAAWPFAPEGIRDDATSILMGMLAGFVLIKDK